MKQISISGNITYHFNIFDFEFFQVVAKHPRLHLKLAIDFVDLLGKIIWNDVTFSSCASESFLIVLRRYHDHETMQQYMSSFAKVAMKFLVNFEKQKVDLMKTHQVEGNKLKAGKNYVRQISNPEDQKMKWIQKTLFIELLKKIITRIGSIHLNNILKPEVIGTYLLIQRKFKAKHKGLQVLIELFGDPETLIKEYKDENKNKSAERDDEVDLVSIKSHKVNNNLKNSVRNRRDSMDRPDKNAINLSVQHRTSKMSPLKQKSMKNVNKDGKLQRDIDSDLNVSVMSEFPIGNSLKQNHEKLMYQPESISLGKYKLKNKLSKNEERALREIEKIKIKRQRRLEDKLFEEERKQMQQEKLKKEIQKELDKRKVEHGVNSKSKKFKKKSLIRDTSLDKDEPLRKEAKIDLYDFSLEEEKDQNDIKNFLDKYKKLLHYLFKTYANTGFSHKQIKDFDQMHNRLETMSLGEAITMLKQNSIIPDLLHKDEARTLLRLVNAHILGDKREGKALTFEAFNSFFLQVAMLVFSRAPINLSQKPPIESVVALLKLFEKSALQRGESTTLFENPDHTIIADNDVLKEINRLLKRNPDTPMPDGFKKIKIKEYKSIYKIPDYMPIPEKNKIALEIMDEILSKNFGFHIFEPISQPVYTYKAKPVLKQLMKFPMGKKDVPFVLKKSPMRSKGRSKVTIQEPIPTRAYKGDRSEDRRANTKQGGNSSIVKNKRFKSTRSVPGKSLMSEYSDKDEVAHRKRVYNEVTPQLGLNLRLEVVKYPMHQREVVQEVAETLEEILLAAEHGLKKLPPRKKYGIHNFMNEAQRMRQKREDDERKYEEKQLHKFEQHKAELNQRLEKMKEERQQTDAERKRKEREKSQKQKEKKKKEMEEAKARVEARHKKDKKKLDELTKSMNQPKKLTEQEKKDKEKRIEFLSNRKAQMRKEFNNLSKTRKGNLTEEEQEEKDKLVRKEKQDKLKHFFEKQKELKAQNDAAKREYLQFYDSPSVQTIFDKSFEIVSESYLTFSKQQKYTKSALPGDFQMSFAAFKKFGHDMKIYPKLISFDDFSHIFKMITKENIDKNKTLKIDEEEKHADKDSLNINFNEFKDALTRIAWLAKFKLGGLHGISDKDKQTKEKELKSYLKSRWHKGALSNPQNNPDGRNSVNKTTIENNKKGGLINSKNLNSSSGDLHKSRNALQSKHLNISHSNAKNKNLNKSNTKDDKPGSSHYTFEKPKKLSKEEKEQLEREHAINAAKSFSLKNFKANLSKGKSSNRNTSVPAIIYEDTELHIFPEFDTESMTDQTIQVLINYLSNILKAQKSGDNLNNIDIKPAPDASKKSSLLPPLSQSSQNRRN